MGTYETVSGAAASPAIEDVAPSILADTVLALLEKAGVASTISDEIVELIDASQRRSGRALLEAKNWMWDHRASNTTPQEFDSWYVVEWIDEAVATL